MIGIFDSGVGGLSVFREIRKLLPEEKYIYYSDNAHCPYGEKSVSYIIGRAREITSFLISKGAEIIVVACNTATAAAIATLRDEFPVRFIGMEPAVKPACRMTKTRIVGVIATERSLQGEKFLSTLARYGEGVEVIKSVGEGWVEAVEHSEEQTAETEQAVRRVVEPIIERGADVLVLGCTHYPFLKDVVCRVVGDRKVAVIDSGEAVEKRVESLLDEYGLRASEDNQPQLEFVTYADRQYRDRLRQKALLDL